jgi:5-methylcytosine-specific restriction endonuclease McrA
MCNRARRRPLDQAARQAKRRAHWRRKNAIRRGAAHVGRNLTLEQLGERDGWRCHLCRRPVSSRLRSPHPRSATFDHLIPVSNAGTDAPENLRLAHRVCNTRRGVRGTVQLLLVG